MSDGPLIAHSLAEIYLYLMVTPCPNCGRGPLRGSDARPAPSSGRVEVEAVCRSCKHQATLEFALPPEDPAAAGDTSSESVPKVNPTDQPSRIIDVGGWVTLFRVITEAAAKTEDKIESRLLAYEAAQCLEEALKFYEDDDELAPDSAFFNEASRRRYRDNPHLLARSRLIDLRAKLPTLDAMERRLKSSRQTRKTWWRPWK
jgi:hypothetical protein